MEKKTIEVNWDDVSKKEVEKLSKELDEKGSLGYDDYERIVNEIFKELYGCGLYDEECDEDDYPIDYCATFKEYFSEGICDGDIDDYDDEDGWRVRKLYLDIDDDTAICIKADMRVWDYEFFDLEDADDVEIYKVKKVPVQTFEYVRI